MHRGSLCGPVTQSYHLPRFKRKLTHLRARVHVVRGREQLLEDREGDAKCINTSWVGSGQFSLSTRRNRAQVVRICILLAIRGLTHAALKGAPQLCLDPAENWQHQFLIFGF